MSTNQGVRLGAPRSPFEPRGFDFLLRLGGTATLACPELRRGCAPGSSCGGVCASGFRLPSSGVYCFARPQMLIQGLACGFQNEAAITASIQVPLDLTFHARRELPFQVPANQMDGVPAIHSCPTSSGPAWVGPFSSSQAAIRPAEKLFKLEHSGLASPHCSSPRLHTQPLVIPTVVEGSLLSSFHLGAPTRSGHPGTSAHNGRPVVHFAYGCQEENQKEAH